MNVVVEGGEGGGKYNKLPNASNIEAKNENIQTFSYLTILDIFYVPFLLQETYVWIKSCSKLEGNNLVFIDTFI